MSSNHESSVDAKHFQPDEDCDQEQNDVSQQQKPESGNESSSSNKLENESRNQEQNTTPAQSEKPDENCDQEQKAVIYQTQQPEFENENSSCTELKNEGRNQEHNHISTSAQSVAAKKANENCDQEQKAESQQQQPKSENESLSSTEFKNESGNQVQNVATSTESDEISKPNENCYPEQKAVSQQQQPNFGTECSRSSTELKNESENQKQNVLTSIQSDVVRKPEENCDPSQKQQPESGIESSSSTEFKYESRNQEQNISTSAQSDIKKPTESCDSEQKGGSQQLQPESENENTTSIAATELKSESRNQEKKSTTSTQSDVTWTPVALMKDLKECANYLAKNKLSPEQWLQVLQTMRDSLTRDMAKHLKQSVGFAVSQRKRLEDNCTQFADESKRPGAVSNENIENATLFVGNLSFDVTVDDLLDFFSNEGYKLTTAQIITQKGGRSKGFGYVEFNSMRQAEDALDNLNGVELDGKDIRLDFVMGPSREMSRDRGGQRRGRQGGGGRQTTSELNNQSENQEQNIGHSQGFGYVDSTRKAKDALDNLDSLKLDKRDVRLDSAQGPSGGRGGDRGKPRGGGAGGGGGLESTTRCSTMMLCNLFVIVFVVALAICVPMLIEKNSHGTFNLKSFFAENPESADLWEKLDRRSIHILVTGKTGTGKSALINGLIGANMTKEGDSLDPTTAQVEEIKQMVHGVSMSIFDSPGLQDGTRREDEYIRDMQRKCQNVDLVLYAIKLTDQRVHVADTNAISKLMNAFGERFWERAMFVMTFANEVLSPEFPDDDQENLRYFESRLQLWQDKLPKIIKERADIPLDIGAYIPVVPAGYYKTRDLPGRKYWFSKFWMAALSRMMDTRAEGAGYMLEFSQDRLKSYNDMKEEDFEKPIHEQPILKKIFDE